jgi:hypothetical protein
MIYTFDYDISYFPAIPIVEVAISRIKDEPKVTLPAIVDSGADATILPIDYLNQVQTRKGDQAWLRGTAQQRIHVEMYWVWLTVGGHTPIYLQVVGDSEGEEAILGRDVLNQFVVTLNGLASVVEISD